MIIKHPEKITSNQFLVSKTRLEITQALMFQNRMVIVEVAD